MRLPPWLLFVVAAWVIAFGAYRLFIAFSTRSKDENRPDFRKKGLYGRSRRSHAVLGGLYLLGGALLVAMALGWQPPIGALGCAQRSPESSAPAPPSDRAPGN